VIVIGYAPGSEAEARDCLLPVVRRQQQAAWVWSLLGRTFEDEDADKAMTCYFRALQLAGHPSEREEVVMVLIRISCKAP
jgi:hypothetical protein